MERETKDESAAHLKNKTKPTNNNRTQRKKQQSIVFSQTCYFNDLIGAHCGFPCLSKTPGPLQL